MHGDVRVDDWYWLRDRKDPAVVALLEAENAHTEMALAHLEPLREELYESMLAKVRLTDVTYPTPNGAWAYYRRTIEGLEYRLYCRRPVSSPLPSEDPAQADDFETVLLDENQVASGKPYFHLGDTALSADQRLLAYVCDVTGGERMALTVRDLEHGEDLPDVIEDTYYGLAFSLDGGTIFYTRPDDAMRPYQIWRHRLGAPESEDTLVLEENDERFFLGVHTTKDNRYVVLSSDSNVTSEVRLVRADRPDEAPVLIAERRQGVTYSVEHHEGDLLVLSNDGAENFQLYRTPADDVRRDGWEVLIPQRDDVRLEEVDVVRGFALVSERGNATTSVRLLPLKEGEERVVEAPPAGHVGLSGNADFDARFVRYETETIVHPRTLHELDLATGTTRVLWHQPVRGHDPSRYRTERRYAVSADGTKVPVTLAWREEGRDGAVPCLLYGYGSYESSVDPVFRLERPLLPLIDKGMLVAIAHVRGGGELGRHWYLDGKLQNKHHSFEDFVAAGRMLVEEGLTSPSRLAAMGRSAGGLLMGASVNLAPGLFAAAVAEVPFVDCLTTMLDPTLPLTVTEYEEWGNPAEAGAYDWMRRYSPYDNVTDGVEYPRILATGGLNDPRVSYFEPAKWVQRLRAADPRNVDKVFLQTEMAAGHSGPSGRYVAWKRWAFVLAFVIDSVNGAVGAS